LGSVPTVVMGSKSRSGWYFSFGFSEMLIACDPVTPMITVYPSGAARDTASAPTEPPAPARFSMFTGCFQACDSCSPITRAAMSVEPPGGNGTTSRMGWFG
jgi:hypothetical protein